MPWKGTCGPAPDPPCSPAPGLSHHAFPGRTFRANCRHSALDTWAVPISQPSLFSQVLDSKSHLLGHEP